MGATSSSALRLTNEKEAPNPWHQIDCKTLVQKTQSLRSTTCATGEWEALPMSSVLAPEANFLGKNAHLSLEVILASCHHPCNLFCLVRSLLVKGGGLGQTLSDPKSQRKSGAFNKFLSITRGSRVPHLQSTWLICCRGRAPLWKAKLSTQEE